MARYQIIFAYDGTEFFGSQRQANGSTAQGELESALRRLGWQGKTILLAGRTDSGVHAAGQVAACDLAWNHTPAELLRAINSHLPPAMAVSQVQAVRSDFHPRFDAISRSYRYSLFCQPQRDPLRERFSWRVWPSLSDELLFRAAPLLIGSHDFAAFGTPPRPAGGTQRNVFQSAWRKIDQISWQFEVSANAFLYRMVRRMVFLQVSVAQEKTSLDDFSRAIHSPGSVPVPAGLAPAHGLTLLEVQYPDDLA